MQYSKKGKKKYKIGNLRRSSGNLTLEPRLELKEIRRLKRNGKGMSTLRASPHPDNPAIYRRCKEFSVPKRQQ